MYISNDDLEFLVRLENKLGLLEDWSDENWSDDLNRLWQLNEKLIQQRKANNEKARKYVADRRKADKNYARGKRD